MSNYKNLASTVLENSGLTTDTSITMPSTTAALFPTPPFYATIMPTNSGLANGSNSEIVEVTAATTSGANTIFSISRAQRGTSAISWDANEAILSHAIYTQDMPFIDNVLSTPSSVAYVATDNIQTGAITTPKIADGAVTSDKIDFATLTFPATLTVGDGTSTTVNVNAIDLGNNIYLLSGTFNGSTTTIPSSQRINVKLQFASGLFSSCLGGIAVAYQNGQSSSYTTYARVIPVSGNVDCYAAAASGASTVCWLHYMAICILASS